MKLHTFFLPVIALTCVASASGQAPFTPGAALVASVRRIPTQPGKWEILRSDVRGGKPYLKCMTAGDWDMTKSRALGEALVPPGCRLAEVAARGQAVKTVFACKDSTLVEEWEFGKGTFRNRAVETPAGGARGEVTESTGTLKGSC